MKIKKLKKVKKYAFLALTYLFRNEYSIEKKPSLKNQVNVEYCSSYNIGDTLSPVIVNHMLESRGIRPDQKVSKTKHLMAVGSVMAWGMCDATVWGSGFLKACNIEILKKKYRKLGVKYDIRAVRGPCTRNELLKAGVSCPEVFGDPAVLMPEIYMPEKQEKKYPVTLILHLRTKPIIGEDTSGKKYQLRIPENIHVLSPETDDYKAFLDEIVASEYVISSSLHGIILAESYGVPTVFLNWGMDDQQTKFNDWYLSTGRQMQCAHSIEEALNMEPMPLPDLAKIRNDLKKAFPYDLWEK